MKENTSLLIKSIIILNLLIPAFGFADAHKTDHQDKSLNNTECSAVEEMNIMPISTEDENISYVSGGVCLDDVEFMKGIAHQYPLEIVLVEKNDEYQKENYIADVRVIITDIKKEKKFLDVHTEGPFLLVNLPDEKYLITAEYNGKSREYKAIINNKKHKRVVFLWSASDKE
jgi:hypothetical protein